METLSFQAIAVSERKQAIPRRFRVRLLAVAAVVWLALLCPTQAASTIGITFYQGVVDADLTSAGGSDWAIWGTGLAGNLAPDQRKTGVPPLISDLTAINPAGEPLGTASGDNNGHTFDWYDGNTVTTASDIRCGIRNENAAGRGRVGFSFTVPATMNPRRLKVYASSLEGRGLLTARLSDGTVASDRNLTNDFIHGTFDILVSANTPGQTLTGAQGRAYFRGYNRVHPPDQQD